MDVIAYETNLAALFRAFRAVYPDRRPIVIKRGRVCR